MTIVYLTSSLSPTMLPDEADLETTRLTFDEALELINDPDTELRVGGATKGMRNFLAHHFPGLDIRTTYQDIEAKPGQEILVTSYSGQRLPFNGIPEGDYSVRYTQVALMG